MKKETDYALRWLKRNHKAAGFMKGDAEELREFIKIAQHRHPRKTANALEKQTVKTINGFKRYVKSRRKCK